MGRVLIGVAGVVVAGLGAVAIAQGTSGTVRVAATGAQTAKGWQTVSERADERLYGITATGPKDAWVSGLTYVSKTLRPLIMHWNGRTWTPTAAPAAAGESAVFDIKAVSASNVWAFALSGKRAFVLHSNGRKWVESGSWAAPKAMPGELLPLSPANVWSFDAISPSLSHPMPKADIHHYDGRNWRSVSLPQAVTGAAGTARSAWAVGYTSPGVPHPAVSHWNGTHWLRVKLPALGAGTLTSVLARTTKDVWAAGTTAGKGLLLHWDGKHWKAIPAGATALQSVASDGRGGLWLATIDGRVLHYANSRLTSASLPPQGPGLTAQMLLPTLIPGTTTLWATGMVRRGLTGQDGLLLEYGR
jgi:hypothetical protein